MKHNNRGWRINIAGDSEQGKELHELYNSVESGGEKCCFCKKTIRRGWKFFVLHQPICFIHRDDDDSEKFRLDFIVACNKCGLNISKTFRATLDGENVRQTPGRAE